MVDRKIQGLADVTVLAEVIRYRVLTADLAHSTTTFGRIRNNGGTSYVSNY
jgi:hypothetical protein